MRRFNSSTLNTTGVYKYFFSHSKNPDGFARYFFLRANKNYHSLLYNKFRDKNPVF